jgi:hypothetical protein
VIQKFLSGIICVSYWFSIGVRIGQYLYIAGFVCCCRNKELLLVVFDQLGSPTTSSLVKEKAQFL